jgi:acyl-coenzyme A synthetase/AMP-(fatty) acid ligase
LTQWFSAPSVLAYLCRFDAVRPGDFPALKRLLWCGEVMPTPTLIYWMERLPHVRFTNLYGPTETTVASTWYTVPSCPTDPKAPVPIGQPCGGERVVVMDPAFRPCAPGVSGELCIGGVGVGPGYWRDPERTREVFVPDPQHPTERLYRTGDMGRRSPDGVLHFEGRCDTQIKSRGYRIELGEIEAALHADPAVSACAVVATPVSGLGTQMICCAYVDCQNTPNDAMIAARLATRVPRYMLPARWRRVPELPLNANGKVDRRAVTAMFAAG